MKRSTERFLTTHTGSLPRPSWWAKFVAIAEGARRASREFWG